MANSDESWSIKLGVLMLTLLVGCGNWCWVVCVFKSRLFDILLAKQEEFSYSKTCPQYGSGLKTATGNHNFII